MKPVFLTLYNGSASNEPIPVKIEVATKEPH